VTAAWRPALHFALFGASAFFAHAWMTDRLADRTPRGERAPIVLSAERVRGLESDFVRRYRALPTPSERRALVAAAVQEEMLYREALRLKLDLGDGSVHRRLLEKMRALSDGPGGSADELLREALDLGLDDDVVIRRLLVEKMRIVLEGEPHATAISDGEIHDFVERHPEDFVQPAAVTFSHVFLSAGERGERLAADAQAIAAELAPLRPGTPLAVSLSDPFPLGHELRSYSQLQLQGRFGKAFAEQIFALAPGRWSGPLTSPYGIHFVWIEEVVPERQPTVEAVRGAVLPALEQERAAEQLERGLARLRGMYEVRVEEPALPRS
jgi:hypothetical protein